MQVRSAPAEQPYGLEQTPAKTGIIYEIKDDRRFGFIRAHDGLEYFFHLTDLANVTWEEIDIGMEIEFQPIKAPTSDRAGKAANVTAVEYEDDWIDEYEDEEAPEEFEEAVEAEEEKYERFEE